VNHIADERKAGELGRETVVMTGGDEKKKEMHKGWQKTHDMDFRGNIERAAQ
jgi:hypothetical protein